MLFQRYPLVPAPLLIYASWAAASALSSFSALSSVLLTAQPVAWRMVLLGVGGNLAGMPIGNFVAAKLEKTEGGLRTLKDAVAAVLVAVGVALFVKAVS